MAAAAGKQEGILVNSATAPISIIISRESASAVAGEPG